jgi:chemotaxis protein methyltransferase CheR
MRPWFKAHSDWQVDVLGTDINEAALAKAREGLYSSWSFRGVSECWKAAHFERHSEYWKLGSTAASTTRFSRLDLIRDEFPSLESGIYDIDFIFCRNVFIYYEPATIRRVLEKMIRSLRPGGYLLTAHGELQGQTSPSIRVRSFPESCVYQKIEQPHAAGKNQPEPAAKESALETRLAALERLARDLADEGRYELAEKWCCRALGENPFAPRIYYLLAKIAEERNEPERAMEMLRRVLYLDPQFVSAYIDLAALYTSRNDARRARKLRLTALDFLRAKDAGEPIEMGATTAGELRSALEAMTGREAES